MYAIYDWAGNRCLTNAEFATFEDAWDYIYSRVGDDDSELSEYCVLAL